MKPSPSNTVVGWFGMRLYTGGAEWKRSLLMTVEFTMASIQLNMLLIVLHAFSAFAVMLDYSPLCSQEWNVQQMTYIQL